MTAATVGLGTKRPPGASTPEGLTDTGIGGIGMAEPTHVKLCECGCGEPAPIATETCKRAGHVKGQPMRFIRYHHYRSPEVRAKQAANRAAVGNEKLRGRPRPDVRRAPVDDDRRQARGRITLLIKSGRLPSANTLPCLDCGHIWTPDAPRNRRHEYDHYLGYAAEHHESVQPVCALCHRKREVARQRAYLAANPRPPRLKACQVCGADFPILKKSDHRRKTCGPDCFRVLNLASMQSACAARRIAARQRREGE